MALTAFCALINFSFASLILGALRWKALPLATKLATWRAGVFPNPGTGLLFLGLLLSPMTGFVIARPFKRPLLWALRFLSGTERDLAFTDVFYKTGNELLGKKVIVSLLSGKVYMGVLLQASGDPNEPDRSIVIQPAMSGFRNKDTHLVTFNIDYFQGNDLPDIRLFIPMKNVQSISVFNNDVHEDFIQRGVTKIEPVTKPEPPLEPEEG